MRIILLIVLFLTGAARLDASDTVRVAAIQCYSKMGETDANCTKLTKLIELTAKSGAKIIVTPECALHGYMDPLRDIVWTSAEEDSATTKSIRKVAETVPGKSTKYFGQLAAQHKIYLCLGMAEEAAGKFYNTQVLFDPTGKIVAHHRKHSPWMIGDSEWMTRGTGEAQTVNTPYGRLGLMICYDLHTMPERLAKVKVDIVLYSIGWYGGNARNWYKNIFPLRYVQPYSYALIGANWCDFAKNTTWDGANCSTIYAPGGKILNMADPTKAQQVIMADLPIRKSLD